MKRVSSLFIMIVFFSACSQKLVSSKVECKELEQKMIKLKKEKKLNFASEVVNVLSNGYPRGVDEVTLNQNIKVLKMKLQECNR